MSLHIHALGEWLKIEGNLSSKGRHKPIRSQSTIKLTWRHKHKMMDGEVPNVDVPNKKENVSLMKYWMT